ncbi:hypothetical protein JHK87_036437 [Glycine soja]|nr:hypothetical protein JHK87_036437 [Glycine soja]
MGRGRLQVQGVESGNNDVAICSSGIKLGRYSLESKVRPTSLFAGVGQAGFGFGISPNPPTATTRDSGTKPPLINSSTKYVLMPETVSRTSVAPLETIRTHLMVGSCGHSTIQVFQSIMENGGWKGWFRGNSMNIIGVAQARPLRWNMQLFAYDTVKKQLSPKPGEQPKIPIPP